MNPFQKEVFIRLSDDGSAFACRIQYGHVYSKTTEFVIGESALSSAVEDAALMQVRRESVREMGDRTN